MALVPGGEYRMFKRRGLVKISAFCIDLTEVTVASYKACVREHKCSPECLRLGQCSAVPTRTEWGNPTEDANVSRYCNGDREDRQEHPANCVSWDEARTYCEAYGKRLPRPEEWEWAMKGAERKNIYPWGTEYIKDQPCWSPKENRKDGTCAVGSHPRDKTPQGVVDMAGNVAEWVAPGKGHPAMVFGASWYAMDDGYLGGALGGVEMPSTRNETVGFRCVGDVAGASR